VTGDARELRACDADGCEGERRAGAAEMPATRVPSRCVPCAPRTPAREEVSAGGVVYRVEGDGTEAARPVFLLIRDSYRNWGFPKGHLEAGEGPGDAALREVAEETGLCGLSLVGAIETIDWYFRFRGRLVHKVCHFFLMRTDATATCPQRDEGITACRWASFEEAVAMVSYANARGVLERARAMVATPGTAVSDSAVPAASSGTVAR
jgi:8-oxo-dGTP pyrophosphatase MutT (NUDIX family)